MGGVILVPRSVSAPKKGRVSDELSNTQRAGDGSAGDCGNGRVSLASRGHNQRRSGELLGRPSGPGDRHADANPNATPTATPTPTVTATLTPTPAPFTFVVNSTGDAPD